MKVEEDEQRGMKRRNDGEGCGQAELSANLQSRKQECAHPLPQSLGREAGKKHLC